MSITIINRQNLDLLRREIDAALESVAAKHGVSIKTGSGKYSNAGHGTLAINIATVSDSGVVQSREADDFRAMANLYGFEPDDLGRTFKHPLSGEVYTITGLKARSGKHPIIAVNAQGKAYVFAETIAKYVQRPEKVAS